MSKEPAVSAKNERQPYQNYLDRSPARDESRPAGPFKPSNEGREGSLLIFVPRNPTGLMIDELTGGYGYSHLAIDCGEVDIPTGRRVMIEAIVKNGVHKAFQDKYGDRHFVRVPLEKTGVDVQAFCDRIRSKLGEEYDEQEALTMGILDDPARQICSDLATVCLPEEMRLDLARQHRAGLLHPLSVVRHGSLQGGFRLFVSPNGFAEYFAAPRGREVLGPDQFSEPVLPDERLSPHRYVELWKLGAAVLACLLFGWIIFRLLSKKKSR
jgi:hypothetical protein